MAKSLVRQMDPAQLEKLVNDCSSMRELLRRLGYKNAGANHETVQKVLDEYGISTQHFTGRAKNAEKRAVNNVFVKNSTATQATLRRWYIHIGYLPKECAICGLQAEWNGKPLSLTLDHINGDHKDDRLENLRWICPNCDRQLDTFAGRNIQHNKKINYCIDCGKQIRTTSVRCHDCSVKHISLIKQSQSIYDTNNQIVTADALQTELYQNKGNFTSVGKNHGVTDNAVRKWCRKLNLPTSSKNYKI